MPGLFVDGLGRQFPAASARRPRSCDDLATAPAWSPTPARARRPAQPSGGATWRAGRSRARGCHAAAGGRHLRRPRDWRKRLAVRRFGFHGLSHAWTVRRAAALVGRAVGEVRVVSCHISGGTSVCAIGRGRSVDTTMGLTPLEGAVMATRSGTVDPGLSFDCWATPNSTSTKCSAASLVRGGLAALSDVGGDLRDVLAAAGAGERSAADALEVWAHRLRQLVASMAATMRGADVAARCAHAGGTLDRGTTIAAFIAMRVLRRSSASWAWSRR
jgi:hypothetical protein